MVYRTLGEESRLSRVRVLRRTIVILPPGLGGTSEAPNRSPRRIHFDMVIFSPQTVFRQ
jgi:hypothetical protein